MQSLHRTPERVDSVLLNCVGQRVWHLIHAESARQMVLLRRIESLCGQLFFLRIRGIDITENTSRPTINGNSVPWFTGVADYH